MPLMWLSLAFLAGVWLASSLSLAAWAWLLLGSSALGIAFLGFRLGRSSRPLVARLGSAVSHRSPLANLPYLVLAGFCLLGAGRYALAKPTLGPGEVTSYAGDHNTYVVEGVVTKPPDEQDNQTVLTISSERSRLFLASTWTPLHGQVLARLAPGEIYHYGDRLQLRGTIEPPSSDPASSYRQYLAGQGIYAVMNNPQAVLIAAHQGNPLLDSIYAVKEGAQAVVRRIYPDPEASLVGGILLGNDSGLSPEVANAFRKTSTTHIIAISGFNIGIVAALFSTLFGKLLGSKRRMLAAGLSASGILVYTILVGASASVVRAAVMGGLSLFAVQIGRRQDGLNSLAFTAALMSLFNPAAPWDVGFQLSFLATLGLVLLAEPWSKAFTIFAKRFLSKGQVDRLTGPVAEYFLFTLAAQVFTLPVMAYHFGRISLVAFLVNPAILPAQAPLMILGGLSVLLGFVSTGLGNLSAALAWPFVAYTIRAVEWFAALPIPQINLGQVSLALVLAYYVFLLAWIFRPQALSTAFIRVRPAIPLVLFGLGVLFAWQVVLAAPDGRLHVVVLDVSSETVSGDGVLIRTPEGRYLLVNGGPSPNRLSDEIGRRLKWNQLDWLVAASPGDNQIQGVPRLLERYPPGQVLWASQDYSTDAAIRLRGSLQAADIPIYQGEAGQVLDLGSGARLRLVRAGAKGSVLLLEWNDFRLLLPLGTDAKDLVGLSNGREVGRVTALLLAGNGKAALNPAVWVENLNPQVVLLSVAGQDEVGMPSQETLEALEGYTLLRTDLNGWIELITDGKQMWVEVERKK